MGSNWHIDFIESVGRRIKQEQPLSTRQAEMILRIAAERGAALAEGMHIDAADIRAMVACPAYRREPYASRWIRREARYIGDNKLALRFKMDRAIITELKTLGSVMGADKPVWIGWASLWIVPVTRQSLARIVALISSHGFHCNDATIDYLTMAHNSRGMDSAFVLDADSGTIVANVCDNPVLAAWIANVLRVQPA